MCGIAGMIGTVDGQSLRVMTQMLVHRGPDDGAVWTDTHAGLGHRRLKIIDLSDNARQPMPSADGRFVLAFNGEIFNYRELREELRAEVDAAVKDFEAAKHWPADRPFDHVFAEGHPSIEKQRQEFLASLKEESDA